jgi:phage shock protein A
MMLLDTVLLRLILWIGLPVLLAILAIGPRRAWRALKKGWNWLWNRRLDPEEVLTRVVKEHEEHVAALRGVLARSEAAEAEIVRNVQTCEKSIAALDKEAVAMASTSDDLGARGVLYKLNLERAALDSFRAHLERQRNHIAEIRRHLYLLELQTRQYEVGRSILLSQLAEAKTVEQQAAIAAHFDPFNAVASWQQAEGMVQEKALNAKAAERVYADLVEMPLSNQPAQVNPAALDAQLAELKGRLGKVQN